MTNNHYEHAMFVIYYLCIYSSPGDVSAHGQAVQILD